MPDENGYPTRNELLKINRWDAIHDPRGLLEYVQTIWWPDGGLVRISGKRVLRVEMHTGGWSGNEEIVGHLEKTMLWRAWWQSSVRGGHEYLVVRPFAKARKATP